MTLSPILTDARGPYTLVLFTNRRMESSCFTMFAAATQEPPTVLGFGGRRLPHVSPPANGVRGVQFGGGSTVIGPHGEAAHWVEVTGRAGEHVKGVTIVLASGTRVVASVSKGWFTAWWPGAARTKAIEVTAHDVTKTRSLYDPLIRSRMPRHRVRHLWFELPPRRHRA